MITDFVCSSIYALIQLLELSLGDKELVEKDKDHKADQLKCQQKQSVQSLIDKFGLR